ITERAKKAGSIARVIDRHQQLFLEARPPRAEVAIVYNPLAHFVGGRQRAAAYGGPQGEVIGIERDSLLGVHRALFPRNVPLDYVHIDHLSAEKLAQYKLVFFPYPLMLPEATAKILAEYVRGGGTLVAEARLAWNNERGYASERIPGLGLWEVMGCRETAIETAPGGRTTLRWTGNDLPGLSPGAVLPGRWYKETLEPLSSTARIVAEFEDGSPAAVMSTHGKGRTLMLGSYLSGAYQSKPTPEAERFFAGLLQWAGITLPIEVKGSPLEARHLESGNHAVLFLFNHATAPANATVTLRRPAGSYTATDLVLDRDVPVTRAGDGVSLDVQLPPSGVQVIRIARQ
ncbi:MAG TPA: beta-galactosidase trimerization domain-containing protein, partial [Vicinamibacterales bacterium]